MISEHISFKEGTFSATATRLGLPNAPSKEHLANMQVLAKKVFEPLRVYVDLKQHDGEKLKLHRVFEWHTGET